MQNIMRFALPQSKETEAEVHEIGKFSYRFAYARSADSRKNNENGQDYLELRTDGNRFVFALCDGVSQSFYGELAAQRLGKRLSEWLWELIPIEDKGQLTAGLGEALKQLTEDTRKEILEYSIDDNMVPMLQKALEKKRLIGSESTFVAGMIDVGADYAVCFWMGDSRIRIWSQGNEVTAPFEGQFLTKERWSSNKGLVGSIHGEIRTATSFDHLVVYSDGFSIMDQAYQSAGVRDPFSNKTINTRIEDAKNSAASDDVSFLEIWIGDKHPQISTKKNRAVPVLRKSLDLSTKEMYFHWTETEADKYEVELRSNQGTIKSFHVSGSTWHDAEALKDPNVASVSVRAWFDGEPGDWSEPVLLTSAPSPVAATLTSSIPINVPPKSEPKPSRLKLYTAYAAIIVIVGCIGLIGLIASDPIWDYLQQNATLTMTPSLTLTFTATFVPTTTPSPTLTPSVTLTAPVTLTSTGAPSLTVTASQTPTYTVTPSPTITPTSTQTPTRTVSPTPTATPPTPSVGHGQVELELFSN